jgi:YD repeat-containing protein
MAEEQAGSGRLRGFTRLLQGSQDRGMALIGDNGYEFPIPEYLVEMGAMTPREWCDLTGTVFLTPFSDRATTRLTYDSIGHRVSIVDIDDSTVIFTICHLHHSHMSLTIFVRPKDWAYSREQ